MFTKRGNGSGAAAVMLLALWGWTLGCNGNRKTEAGPADARPPAQDARTSRIEAGLAPAGRSGRAKRGRAEKHAEPGGFDFYLLTLSWSPEYCLTHPTDVQCAAAPGFVLHGLWPENTDGTYPEDCSTAAGPSDPSAYKDIYPDAGLLAHEWAKHGTCSGLAADAYFQAERTAKAALMIPEDLAGKQTPAQETPAQILGSFAQANSGDPVGDFALSCGNNRLTAVQVCLDKKLKAMSCPAVRSCRANMVQITAPGAAKE